MQSSRQKLATIASQLATVPVSPGRASASASASASARVDAGTGTEALTTSDAGTDAAGTSESTRTDGASVFGLGDHVEYTPDAVSPVRAKVVRVEDGGKCVLYFPGKGEQVVDESTLTFFAAEAEAETTPEAAETAAATAEAGTPT